MNYLYFIAGMGAGAFVATLLMILILHRAMCTKNKAQEDAFEANKRNLEALEKRNLISELQLEVLERIASK